MIVSELIKELSKYPKDAKVKATWEGTFEEVSVYLYKDGKTVMIDADADFYRDRFEYKKKVVNSRNIISIGYDIKKGVLEVVFISGNSYDFLNVPEMEYKMFLKAKSKGDFFGERIIKKYEMY